MESQSSKNKINSFSFRRTEIHKEIFILNKCFPRAHSWQRCSHAALSRFHSRSMIKKKFHYMFLGTPSFLSPFSECQSGCTDLHPQDIYGEGTGSCRKKHPCEKIGKLLDGRNRKPVPKNSKDGNKKELLSTSL